MENSLPIINQNINKTTYSVSEFDSQVLMENFTEYTSIKTENNFFTERTLEEYTDKSDLNKMKRTVFCLDEKF